jgi:hypothetical protein
VQGGMSKPYRPSNGTEGDYFQDQWCAGCARDAAFRADPDSGDGCPIVAATMIFNINEEEYPKEWIEDNNGGNARCTAFTTDPLKPVRCDKTADLFKVSA